MTKSDQEIGEATVPIYFADFYLNSLGVMILFLVALCIVIAGAFQRAAKQADKIAQINKEKNRIENAREIAVKRHVICEREQVICKGSKRKLYATINQERKEKHACVESIKGMKEAVSKMIDRPLDLVFVIDATNSMREEIELVKQNVNSIARIASFLSAKVKLGAVIYRDRNNANTVEQLPLSSNAAAVENFLADPYSRLGGFNSDWPEAVRQGLETAIKKTEWSPGASHFILLIGDAQPYAEDLVATLKLVKDFSSADPSNTVSVILLEEPGLGNFESFILPYFKLLARDGRGGFVHMGQITSANSTSSIHIVESIIKLLFAQRTDALRYMLNTPPSPSI